MKRLTIDIEFGSSRVRHKFMFRVYASPASMRRGLERFCAQQQTASPESRQWAGFCISMFRETGQPRAEIVIWLNENDLRAGIVAHEIMHAVDSSMEFRYGKWGGSRRRYVRESAAMLMEVLTNSFWDWRAHGGDVRNGILRINR